MKRRFVLTLAASVALAGCSGTPAGVALPVDPAPAAGAVAAVPIGGDYRVNAYDTLDVSVFQVDSLNRTVQVAATGMITMPLIGQVPAAGRTTTEIQRDITARLGANYLQSPQVSVTVKQAASQSVTVAGAVKKPGVFPMTGSVSLMQSLAQAEGFNEVADQSTAVLFRTEGGRRTMMRYDVSAIRSGSAGDPSLQAGDIVVAEESGTRVTLRDLGRLLPIAQVGAYTGVW